MEDTYLWARMIKNGAVCYNIDESLVFVRIGHDMFERRGGWQYFINYRAGRKQVLSTGYINYAEYLETVVIQFFVALMPRQLRGIVFKKVLHSGRNLQK